jgi:CP family cyanate transporter-like MFS transporter
LPYIISDFNLSHTEASFIGAIPPLLMGLLAFPAPRLARRFGLDIVLVIAVAICGFSGAARGWASNGLEFLLATAGVGAGIAVAQTLLGGVIKTAFPNNTSLVMSLYAATLSSGAAVSALATQQLISLTGHWSLATGVWSCVSLVAALAWAFIKTREHRPDVHHGPSPPMPASAIRAWQIALYFTITGILFYALFAWLAPLYCELGLPASQAASAVAVFSAAFMVGNLLMGWFSRARDRRLWLFLSSLCASMGLIALAIAPMHLPFVVVSACGVGLGGSFTLGLTIVLDNTRSAEEADQWNAFVMGIGYSIAALGPVIFGYSHDAFGSYHIALWCCAAISMLAVPITFVLRPLRSEPSAD